MGVIEELERAQLREVPVFKSGDTVRVHFKVIEGSRERIQVFQGFCISKSGQGARETFTVRKQSFAWRGAHVPVHFPQDREDRSDRRGRRGAGQALLLRDKLAKKPGSRRSAFPR